MIVAGIGATSKATASDMTAAVREARERAGIDMTVIRVLAGPPRVAVRLGEAAKLIGARLDVCDLSRLRAEGERCTTRSERSMAETGVPCVAEAAALAAAGIGGRLRLPRIIVGPVTIAVAESLEATPP